jgi:lipopolysaccharide export system ATP-binding protein
MHCLKVVKLKKKYGDRAIVRDLSFDVQSGEIVGLLGPNGAGKTTAFYMAIGLIRPDDGTVLFQGQDVTKLPMHERAKLGMGFLSQEPSIFPTLSVEDNIKIVLEQVPLNHDPLPALLEELHLTHLAKKKAATLSGGERRRLEITRSLATNPKLLLLDEPFANIDPKSIADVKDLIRHLSAKGISILITDHNAREIFSVVNKSYIIQDGTVLLAGTTEELVHHELAKQHYLGHSFVI